jgi:hypothetical protein
MSGMAKYGYKENIMGSKLTLATYILRFIVLSFWLHSRIVASMLHNMTPRKTADWQWCL